MASSSLRRRFVRRAVRRGAYVALGVAGLLLRPLRGRRDGRHPGAILVIRLDLLGDVLFSMPAVEALRRTYPGAHITMLTLPYTAPLARRYPSLDRVIEVDTNRIRTLRGLIDPRTWLSYWAALRTLRRRRPDLALSLSGPMASLWALLSGARRTVGYQDEAYPFLLTDAVPGGRYRERKPEPEYVLELARAAGAVPTPGRLSVPISEAERESARALLGRHGITETDLLVVVHAGSANGSAKRWPAASWARFVDLVTAESGARVVLVGAESDAALAQDVAGRSARLTASLVGGTSLDELLGVLERADLVATGDSGPLHLAVALQRPVLAPYGPTDPLIHGPYRPSAPAVLLRRDLVCSPCYSMAVSAECPLGDPICMRLVTVEEMVGAALRLLHGGSRRAG